jgi:hypothetical protein
MTQSFFTHDGERQTLLKADIPGYGIGANSLLEESSPTYDSAVTFGINPMVQSRTTFFG